MIESFNKNIFTDTTLRRVAENTGISSVSDSSKIANLVKSLNEYMYKYIAEVKIALDNSLATTADVGFLESIGINKGKPRFKQPLSYTTATSKGIYLTTANRSNLPVILDNQVVIPKGAKIDIGGILRLHVSEDVTILSSQTEVSIDGVIEPLSNGPLIVSEGQEFLADSDLYPSINGLVFKFSKQIRIKTQQETEEEYRAAVLLAARTPINGAYTSVSQSVLSIPGVSQISINSDPTLGKVRIGVITQDMSDNGYEPIFGLYKNLIEDTLLTNGSEGISYDVFQPRKLTVGINITGQHSVDEVESLKSRIVDGLQSTYGYPRSVSFVNIINSINSFRGTESKIFVDRVYLFDEILNDYVDLEIDQPISVPYAYYLYFSENSVEFV